MKKNRTDNFQKFANKKSGAAIKEAYRQEKRKVKAEAREKGEAMRQAKKDKMRDTSSEIRDKKTEIPRSGVPRSARNDNSKPTLRQAQGDKQQPVTRNSKPETGVSNPETGSMPLNKFIAHCGVCGRREAAELVKEGKVTVNGDKVFEPGYKVSDTDKIIVKGKRVFLQKNSVYILLNKPKDFITTSSDPQGRKTVLDLIKGATTERVYPVGRLDRNTTGVLILTNDGELAQKLTHPSFEVKKIYEVTLDKPVAKADLDQIASGVTLEDGFVAADSVGYANTKDKHIVGIEIHSGKNRIVRRIFEHLGYDVKALDRVMFANLTKKNVERSKWRYLNEKEVRLLKFMNNSFVRKQKG